MAKSKLSVVNKNEVTIITNIIIPTNEYKVPTGNYSVNQFVQLMRNFKHKPDTIQFLADMLEV